jgi:ubiquinone/menaquinone biosynthesis C-methylase UbiE
MVYGEHIVRYQIATELVKDKVVLDIASGSGYGTKMLGAVAKRVIGVDLNEGSIKYAQKNYSSKNIDYKVGDAENIPVEDGSVDVVVSFETIEHVPNYVKFIDEVKRVLREDGLLVLSTPNDEAYPETNEWHLHEFKQSELEKLIKRKFKNITTLFQGAWLYSALLDEHQLSHEWENLISTTNTSPLKPNKAIYFVMLCSDTAIKKLPSPRGAIAEPWSIRQNQEHEGSIRKHIEEQKKIMDYLDEQNKNKDAMIKNLQDQLNKIHYSKAWKVLHKAAVVKRAIKK